MLKEVVFILYVCTPPAAGAEDGGPSCRPEALKAAAPAAVQQVPQVCGKLGEAAQAKWGEGGTERPEYAQPITCFAVDHTPAIETLKRERAQ